MEEEIKQFPEVTNIFEPIDLTIFTEEVKVEFQNLCSNINEIEKEEKALVISKNLFHKFFSIFSLKDLSENNISENIYYLERCPQQIKEYQIIFLFPSKIEYINIILKQIKKIRMIFPKNNKIIQKIRTKLYQKLIIISTFLKLIILPFFVIKFF